MIKEIQLLLGLYPRKIFKRIGGLSWYRQTKREFKKQHKQLDVPFGAISNYPCLLDRDEEGGSATGHYFHQDLLVAQKIFKANPEHHVDIGSRVAGFVAHVASFREITVLDIRHITPTIENVKFEQGDCMNLDSSWFDTCQSVSSLHAIEHFGLGRYGDPIDVEGHLKGLNTIYNMLKVGGVFYFSVPIGLQRIEFNAHRVFSLHYLLSYFEDKYSLQSFSYVDDSGDLHKEKPLTAESIASNCNCNYGCGIFELIKKSKQINGFYE